MQKIIHIAIIGCGAISELHAKAIQSLPGAVLCGVYDKDILRAQDFARRYSCRAYAAPQDILGDPDVDAVAICTPSGLHAQLTVAAAEAGKHVAVEKPLAINLADAQRIIGAQQANAVKITVISQLRFTPEVQALHNAVECGAFGTPVLNSLSMRYHRSPAYYQAGGWRGSWAMDGGGALMNQGIHGVDLMCYICGPVTSVFARSKTLLHAIETEDTVCATLEFASGALGVLEATTAAWPGKARRLEIGGTQGSASLEENTIVQWDLPLPKPQGRKNWASGAANDPGAIHYGGHRQQYLNFTAAIRGEEDLLIDAKEGCRALEVILAIYRSAQCGKPIML